MTNITLKILLGILITASGFSNSFGTELQLDLLRQTNRYIEINNYEKCDLSELKSISPATKPNKIYSDINYIELASNFGLFLGKQGTAHKLTISLGNSDPGDVVFFEADTTGKCIRKSADGYEVTTQVTHYGLIEGTTDQFRKLELISEDNIKNKLRRRTKFGSVNGTGHTGKKGELKHQIYITYNSKIPENDVLSLENGSVINIKYSGKIVDAEQKSRRPKF